MAFSSVWKYCGVIFTLLLLSFLRTGNTRSLSPVLPFNHVHAVHWLSVSVHVFFPFISGCWMPVVTMRVCTRAASSQHSFPPHGMFESVYELHDDEARSLYSELTYTGSTCTFLLLLYSLLCVYQFCIGYKLGFPPTDVK